AAQAEAALAPLFAIPPFAIALARAVAGRRLAIAALAIPLARAVAGRGRRLAIARPGKARLLRPAARPGQHAAGGRTGRVIALQDAVVIADIAGTAVHIGECGALHLAMLGAAGRHQRATLDTRIGTALPVGS